MAAECSCSLVVDAETERRSDERRPEDEFRPRGASEAQRQSRPTSEEARGRARTRGHVSSSEQSELTSRSPSVFVLNQMMKEGRSRFWDLGISPLTPCLYIPSACAGQTSRITTPGFGIQQ